MNKVKQQRTRQMDMNFVRVLKNHPNAKQAIFLQPESGQHYLYSYINHEMAHETMIFTCDADGESNMSDLVSAHGYEHSNEMMDRLIEVLS